MKKKKFFKGQILLDKKEDKTYFVIESSTPVLNYLSLFYKIFSYNIIKHFLNLFIYIFKNEILLKNLLE